MSKKRKDEDHSAQGLGVAEGTKGSVGLFERGPFRDERFQFPAVHQPRPALSL